MKSVVKASVFSFIVCAMLGLFSGCDRPGKLGPLQRLGPPGMVMQGDEQRLWVLFKQEETWRYTHQALYHFELHGYDTRTAQRTWTKRLLTVPYKDGGYNAGARILGQGDGHVWLFMHDQPVALSSVDGAVATDRARLEAANPALKGIIPSEPAYYTFDGGLVMTTADARRWRINAADFKAQPYTPASDEAFRRLSYMSTQWNGGYQTKDFLVRQGMLWGRWIGLHTEKEAAEEGKDGWGSNLKNPLGHINEGDLARRMIWGARIGKTKQFSEGSHDRLFDVTRLPGGADYLQGGFLIRQGSKTPFQVGQPDGTLVLHRTRIDADGRLVLSRLDNQFREQWKTELPFTELLNRWEWPDRLMMIGKVEIVEKGSSRHHERLVVIYLADGRMQSAH